MPTRSSLFAPPVLAFAAVATFAGALLAVACGGDDDAPLDANDAGAVLPDARPPEQTGQACTSVTECYPDVADAAALGEVRCLDRVPGGYCTHACAQDTECCAVPGECKTDFKQVCAPLESTGTTQCFLSCEDEDVARAAADGGLEPREVGDAGDAGDGGAAVDPATLFCQRYGAAGLACRSTGGGRENRKVCLP